MCLVYLQPERQSVVSSLCCTLIGEITVQVGLFTLMSYLPAMSLGCIVCQQGKLESTAMRGTICYLLIWAPDSQLHGQCKGCNVRIAIALPQARGSPISTPRSVRSFHSLSFSACHHSHASQHTSGLAWESLYRMDWIWLKRHSKPHPLTLSLSLPMSRSLPPFPALSINLSDFLSLGLTLPSGI